MTQQRWLIVGCGYVGTALGIHLLQSGRAREVVGVRRTPAYLPFPCITASTDAPDFAALLPKGPFDRVVYCAAAKSSDPAAYEHTYVSGAQTLVRVLQQHQQEPARFLFTSSTAVYEADDGRIITEDTVPHPENFRGQTMLRAEEVFLKSGWPAVVLRLGGIYGPERTSYLRRVREGKTALAAHPAYANRIHRDDCAGALAHVGNLKSPASLYLGVDDAPADRNEVTLWLAARMSLPTPRMPAPQAGGAAGKRCLNERLRASGYSFLYPTYREGYGALLAEAGFLTADGR